MLKVQNYLTEKTKELGCPILALDALKSKYAISAKINAEKSLVILVYCQIDSNKQEEIVRECRGLCLEFETWRIVARPFFRFFNQGEIPAIEKNFDWNNFSVEEKADGSLFKLFKYNGLWNVQTRGSFALTEIMDGCGVIWEEGFYRAIVDEKYIDELPEQYTYLFEFCSPWNKVVRRYDAPNLFLLTAIHNASGLEINENILDNYAKRLGVQRPQKYHLKTIEDIKYYLEIHEDATFEGVVLRDRHGMRLKVKKSSYVNLHHLGSNGNLCNIKNLIPLVLKNEEVETITYFPEIAEKLFDVSEKLGAWNARMQAVWAVAQGIEKQKDFALYVTKHAPKLSTILFNARKSGRSPQELFREAEDLLIKLFQDK